MIGIFSEHKNFWNESRKKSLYLGILLLLLALVIQIGAGRYSARVASTANFANDLFLDNLPVVNLDFVIVGGSLIFFWTIPWLMFILRPRYVIFAVKATALFLIVRAFFLSLTHIGLYPTGIMPSVENHGFKFYSLTSFTGNFFFSGHTGYPFLVALILWNRKFWRRFYLAATVFFGAVMLLAHVHYSIDVFAAPFITYGIYVIATKIFPHDYALAALPAHSPSAEKKIARG